MWLCQFVVEVKDVFLNLRLWDSFIALCGFRQGDQIEKILDLGYFCPINPFSENIRI